MKSVEDVAQLIVEVFPILGGRLLKDFTDAGFKVKVSFPILGGRLLKR